MNFISQIFRTALLLGLAILCAPIGYAGQVLALPTQCNTPTSNQDYGAYATFYSAYISSEVNILQQEMTGVYDDVKFRSSLLKIAQGPVIIKNELGAKVATDIAGAFADNVALISGNDAVSQFANTMSESISAFTDPPQLVADFTFDFANLFNNLFGFLNIWSIDDQINSWVHIQQAIQSYYYTCQSASSQAAVNALNSDEKAKFWNMVAGINSIATKLASSNNVVPIASTTQNGLLQAPSLSSSLVGAPTSLAPTFSWSAVSGANKYWLMVAARQSDLPLNTAATGCANCIISGSTNQTTYTPTNPFTNLGKTSYLKPNTTYFWQVMAFNDTATSLAGNYSAQQSFSTLSYSLDVTAPGAPINLSATPTSWTNGALFYLDWTNPTDVSNITKVWWKVGSPPSSPSDGTAQDLPSFKPLQISVQNEGITSVYVWLQDGSGNSDYRNSATIDLKYDSTRPVISITGPTTDSTLLSESSTVNLSGLVSDSANGSGLNSIFWADGQGNGGSITANGTSWASGPIYLAKGTNLITVWAIDNAGNFNSAKITISYSPQITSPPACGSAAGATFASVPTNNLCPVGATASSVTGIGPWFWSCTANAFTQNCAADIQAFTISTATSGSGTISPTSATVALNKTVNFTIAPNIGFKASVSGCGISQNWIASPTIVTTSAVTAGCTVTATFASNPTSKYSRVCNSGLDAGQGSCPATPNLGSGVTDWACTRDNTNGLLWEVKTADGGLRDRYGTYTWYDPNPVANGGKAGVFNRGVCVGARCDTSGYADAVAATGLCGANDWRVPTQDELLTLVDPTSASNGLAAIDANYFPNTLEAPYWSGTSFAGDSNSAWEMNFFHEYANGTYAKAWDNRMRLVRGGTIGGQFGLTVSLIGSGSVTSIPAGIDCGSSCTLTLAAGSAVTLNAVADPSATFIGWTGACAGSNTSCAVTMSQYRGVTAQFTSLVVNGTCGRANGSSYPVTPPAADLCTTGSASALSGSGPWNWSCIGNHEGTNASCSASLLPSSAIMTGLRISGPATLSQGSSAGYGLVASYSDGSSRSISLGPSAGYIVPVVGHGLLASFVNSYGVALAPSGGLYYSDQGTMSVWLLSPMGALSQVAGSGAAGFGGDGGPASAALFRNLQGIAIGQGGELYIADTVNNRIRMVSATGTITTIAGTGVKGYSGDGGLAASAQLWLPFGVTLDAGGSLYILEVGRVRKVAPDGTIRTFAGSGTTGFSGDGGPALNAQFDTSQGNVAFDSSGNLYFADTNNHRVRKISATGNVITTAVGTGVCGHSGDNGLAINAQICYPRSVFVDGDNNLYVADNTTVRKVSSDGIIKTVAGGGQPIDNIGDYGAATAAEIEPNGIAVDGSGNIYIADGNGQSIREVLAVGGGSLNLSATSFASLNGGTLQAATVAGDQTVTLNASYVENGITKTASLPVTITYSATGTGPALTLSTPSPFSAQLGATSAPQSVTLKNTGSAQLNIASIVANGDFLQSGCGATLAAGASCTIAVSFEPTDVGPRIGSLTVVSNATGSPHVVSLIGTGTAAVVADVSLSSAALNFAAQAVGSSSAAQVATLTSIGNAALNLASVVTSGDFVSAGSCGGTNSGTVLAVGQACTVSVTFAPSGVGTRTGSVTITSNATGGSSSIALSGMGSLATQSIAFGAPPSIAVGGTGTVIAAGGASGNAITFTTTTPTICTVSGSTVTGVGAGTCVIAADQAGNANFSAAPQATQSFTIAAATQTLNLAAGWNLIGNSYSISLDVASTFGDPTKVLSVWKWIRDSTTPANDSRWAFFSPNNGTTITDNGAAYAASKGYLPLATIQSGEGYWINAVAPFTVSVPAGRAVIASDLRGLPHGWNLISLGAQSTPSRFNVDLSSTPPSPGVVPINITSLWVWDSALAKWYFYSSALEAQGGTALLDYLTGKGYLDFASTGKTLGAGTGLWSNLP